MQNLLLSVILLSINTQHHLRLIYTLMANSKVDRAMDIEQLAGIRLGNCEIESLLGKGYFIGIRLYSPTQAFFDQTWIPDDIVKLK
jgi:hypothetical protein